jgi:hypothetical protein
MRARIPVIGLLLAVMVVPRAQRRPNVLLLTLDTTRADRMGFLGSTRGLTPELDALARGSVVFTRAYAQAPITTVSHATILTGTFPPFHHVNDFGSPLAPSVPYLPSIFAEAGYRTAAFVASLRVSIAASRRSTPAFDSAGPARIGTPRSSGAAMRSWRGRSAGSGAGSRDSNPHGFSGFTCTTHTIRTIRPRI